MNLKSTRVEYVQSSGLVIATVLFSYDISNIIANSLRIVDSYILQLVSPRGIVLCVIMLNLWIYIVSTDGPMMVFPAVSYNPRPFLLLSTALILPSVDCLLRLVVDDGQRLIIFGLGIILFTLNSIRLNKQ